MNYTTDPNNTRYYSSDSAIGSPDLSSQNITTNDDLNELPGCHYTESTHGNKFIYNLCTKIKEYMMLFCPYCL